MPELEEFDPFLWRASFWDGYQTLYIARSRKNDDSAIAGVLNNVNSNPNEKHAVSERRAIKWFACASRVFYERLVKSTLSRFAPRLPPWQWNYGEDRQLDKLCEKEWWKSQRQSVSKGALFGALIGDAAGATLEFLGRAPTAQECNDALQMRGGGVWGTAPGQITDDGELTLCLAQAISGKDYYDAEGVAVKYIEWYASQPFDIGIATRTAFSVHVGKGLSVSDVMRNAALRNARSKANGALMRATPLGIWGHRLSSAALRQAAFTDTALSHPNISCQYATAAYVAALSTLVNWPGDAEFAIDCAQSQLNHNDAQEVAAWLDEALANKNCGYYPQAGFVRYAFTHAFRHLNNGTSYIDAIRETLLGGGDTDTNACIVGGLVGALHGYEGIPDQMKVALLQCNTRNGNPRPDWLTTRSLVTLAESLVN